MKMHLISALLSPFSIIACALLSTNAELLDESSLDLDDCFKGRARCAMVSILKITATEPPEPLQAETRT